MDKIKTSFTKTKETEIDRILYTAREVAVGFYLDNNYLPVPRLGQYADNLVVLPHLDYAKDSYTNFWEIISKTKSSVPMVVPKQLEQIISDQIDEIYINSANLKKLEKEWNSKTSDFLNIAKSIFGRNIKLIDSIEVRVTSFGTQSSWNLLTNTKAKNKLIVYVREDVGVERIALSVVANMVRLPRWKEKYSWLESQHIIDYLMSSTALADVFPDYKSTYFKRKNVAKHRIEKSLNYVKSLGVSYPKNIYKVDDDGRVFINGKLINHKLTKSEIKILRLLIENAGSIVYHDLLGDVIWKDEDDFSLWAINKAVGRLRKKLIALGYENIINSVWGRGYRLRKF